MNVKHEHRSWGARKIRERLLRRFSGMPIPAKSTIHAVLDRHGLVERRGRVRRRAHGTALSLGQRPNELWCTDYKGEFLLGNHKYCYPLTVTDHASRFLLTCEALSSTREDDALTVFERLFKERGLVEGEAGRPALDPQLLISLWIYGYSEGVSSAGEIARLCEFDPAYHRSDRPILSPWSLSMADRPATISTTRLGQHSTVDSSPLARAIGAKNGVRT